MILFQWKAFGFPSEGLSIFGLLSGYFWTIPGGKGKPPTGGGGIPETGGAITLPTPGGGGGIAAD